MLNLPDVPYSDNPTASITYQPLRPEEGVAHFNNHVTNYRDYYLKDPSHIQEAITRLETLFWAISTASTKKNYILDVQGDDFFRQWSPKSPDSPLKRLFSSKKQKIRKQEKLAESLCQIYVILQALLQTPQEETLLDATLSINRMHSFLQGIAYKQNLEYSYGALVLERLICPPIASQEHVSLPWRINYTAQAVFHLSNSSTTKQLTIDNISLFRLSETKNHHQELHEPVFSQCLKMGDKVSVTESALLGEEFTVLQDITLRLPYLYVPLGKSLLLEIREDFTVSYSLTTYKDTNIAELKLMTEGDFTEIWLNWKEELSPEVTHRLNFKNKKSISEWIRVNPDKRTMVYTKPLESDSFQTTNPINASSVNIHLCLIHNFVVRRKETLFRIGPHSL